MSTTLLKPRLFTVSEYHAMVPAGILQENDRVELIRGQIIAMSPIGSRHAHCVNRLAELFILRVHAQARLSIQNPVRLSNDTEPQPDLALLVPKEIYAARHPRPDEVLLLVEVAHTSVDFDRQVKIPLYAEAGIREYWIVNLDEECLEVYRQPERSHYAETMTLQRGDTVQVQALPGVEILSVEAILGP